MLQMVEFVEEEIKSFYIQIPYIQEGRGKNEHIKKVYRMYGKGPT